MNPMREILFRAKRTYNGEWVEGCLYRNIYGDYQIREHKLYDDDVYIDDYNIIPETVGQYTGLTDKNGKKIFEGDVCQTKGYKLIDETPFIVVWNDYYSGFYWEDVKNANDTDMFTKTVAELTEVIGNIHDNPELLKGGGEG